MENKINLQSYQNVESVQLNLPLAQLQQYCEHKLLSAEADVEFIKKHIYRGTPLNVCEIGCGNGKLLLALERENLISHAVGYEVSESRCQFANKFLELYQSEKVEIVNKNFLEDNPAMEEYDLIIFVDIVFQFVTPLYDEATHESLQWIYKRLSKGGEVFLELEDYTSKKKDIKEKGANVFWEEFPREDPFKYGLYKLGLDNDGNIIDDKRFILRGRSGEERFRNIIKSYTRKESIELFAQYGMQAEVYPYEDISKEHDLYRILARKI